MPHSRSFLLDENIEKRLKSALIAAGHDAVRASDVGLKSTSDRNIFQYARSHRLTLITYDKDYLSQFSPPHAGILVLRFYSVKTVQAIAETLRAIEELETIDLADKIFSIEAGKPPRLIGETASSA